MFSWAIRLCNFVYPLDLLLGCCLTEHQIKIPTATGVFTFISRRQTGTSNVVNQNSRLIAVRGLQFYRFLTYHQVFPDTCDLYGHSCSLSLSLSVARAVLQHFIETPPFSRPSLESTVVTHMLFGQSQILSARNVVLPP